jgi:hypothetical protein
MFATGSLVAYSSLVSRHNEHVDPVRSSMVDVSRHLIELHKQGLRGQALLDKADEYERARYPEE